MKKKTCLVVLAHPSWTSSFSGSLAENFANGIEESGNQCEYINLWRDNFHLPDIKKELIDSYKEMILNCDGIVFAFPLWWEMPPYPLVEFLQTIFTNGFAYKHDGVKTSILDLPVDMLISMGQVKHFNISNLYEAMEYCGLHVRKALVCQGVGPAISTKDATQYIENAKAAGLTFFQ